MRHLMHVSSLMDLSLIELFHKQKACLIAQSPCTCSLLFGTSATLTVGPLPFASAEVKAHVPGAGHAGSPTCLLEDSLTRLFPLCVLQESMRMFPVVGTGTTRVNPKKDVVLGNGKLHVPRGTIVWIGQHALMNCQANWSDPDKFIPERWAQVRMQWHGGTYPGPAIGHAFIGIGRCNKL